LEHLDPDALVQLGLSVENAEHQVDAYLRIPGNPGSGFRAAVRQDGVPVSDIIQVWLDLSNHPPRGKVQAAEIRKTVFSELLKKERA